MVLIGPSRRPTRAQRIVLLELLERKVMSQWEARSNRAGAALKSLESRGWAKGRQDPRGHWYGRRFELTVKGREVAENLKATGRIDGLVVAKPVGINAGDAPARAGLLQGKRGRRG